MSQPLYCSQSTIRIVSGLHRRAHLALAYTAEFGLHGPIKDFYKLQPELEFPLPVDYIVAATGG